MSLEITLWFPSAPCSDTEEHTQTINIKQGHSVTKSRLLHPCLKRNKTPTLIKSQNGQNTFLSWLIAATLPISLFLVYSPAAAAAR